MSDILTCLDSLKRSQRSLNHEVANLQLSGNPMKYRQEQLQRQQLNERKQQLKMLNRNLQLVVLETFTEFDKPLSEVLNQKDEKNEWKISRETVICLSQILDL